MDVSMLGGFVSYAGLDVVDSVVFRYAGMGSLLAIMDE